jgi:hypothetical protein
MAFRFCADNQDKMNNKNLDKFYTHPDIAKKFVDTINAIVPLTNFDMVIEPSAGSGNILNYLPDNALGIDLVPEGAHILQRDFFSYEPDNYPFHNKKIACVGNPPFGTGYMNPLAKGFFNHAAQWSEIIAFIVPSKWHTSWKVHKQLNKNFGLYYSEILPKNSFLLDNKPHDVNCCMQIWSKSPIGNNLRILERPKTSHEDFDFFLTCDNVPRRKKVIEQLVKKEYWEFGLKYWGKISICDMENILPNTTTHYLFKAHKPYVRGILEQIDWRKYVTNMGAPNIGGKSILIKAYTDKKTELGII